jgi:hypothetical protein
MCYTRFHSYTQSAEKIPIRTNPRTTRDCSEQWRFSLINVYRYTSLNDRNGFREIRRLGDFVVVRTSQTVLTQT